MDFVQTFFLATLVSILGFLPPGMMNMTVVKVALEDSKEKALKFILGTLLIIGIQAFIAIYFSKLLVNHPNLIETLLYVAIFIFFGLSILFFYQARTKKVIRGIADGNFLSGVKMSAMNMLAIPFFFGSATALETSNSIKNQMPDNLFFVLGAVFGCFLLFYVYLIFAKIIQKRDAFVARNINYFLSALFLVLGVVTIFKSL